MSTAGFRFKDSTQGAAVEDSFFASDLIDVPAKAFDDFAGADSDAGAEPADFPAE